MSDSPQPVPGDLTFGAALAELDQVVMSLEGGQLELEESIDRYSRGVALLQALQAKLADAEQRVTMLIGELEAEAAEEPAPSSHTAPSSPAEEEIPF